MNSLAYVKTGLAGLVIGAFVLGASVSSQAATPKQSPIPLAAALPNSFDPFWISIKCGADAAAKTMGAKITWKNTPDNDTNKLIQAINAAMLTKPKALIVSPSDQIAASLGNIQKQGTMVSALNASSNPANYYQTAMTAPADQAIADLADQIVAQVGTSGTFAIFGGIPGYPVLDNRWKPVVAALKEKAPAVKVLDIQYESFDSNKAASMTQTLLTKYPDLKAIYANTGPAGQGVVAGVEQAGKQSTVAVYSYDAVPALVAALKRGTVKDLVAQPAGLMGKLAVQNAVNWVKAHPNNKKPVGAASPQEVLLAAKLLTADNINQKWTSDYQYKATCN